MLESRYIAIIIVIFMLISAIVKTCGEENNGICTRLTSKSKFVSQKYKTTCTRQYRTCWGLDIFRINCKYKTISSECYKIQQKYINMYTVEHFCCPGFQKDQTMDTLNCAKGCADGFYGNNCTFNCDCPINAYKSCDQETGNCTCTAGWTGNNCTEGCPDGYFGDACRNVCPCRNNGTCNSTDGSCNCTEPGWTGKYCDIVCPEGFYGYNCSMQCNHCNENQTCCPHTGKCMCIAGVTGKNCSQVCTNNTYGRDCRFECSCHRSGTEFCDPINGTCRCIPGRTGSLCEYDCMNGTYGDGCKNMCNCSSRYEYCRPSDGQCLRVCLCNKDGTENCDEMLNTCACTSNYSEAQCSTQDRYQNIEGNIIDTCACRKDIPVDNLCVPTNESCTCKPGYTGVSCKEDCPVGTFGKQCNDNCSCSNNSEPMCDRLSGKCDCLPGWTGDQCTTVCADGLFGKNCQSRCLCRNNSTCNKENGTCTCSDAWTGEFCDKDASAGKTGSQNNDTGTSVAIGVSFGIILLVVVIVIIVGVLCRKKMLLKRSKLPNSTNNPVYGLVDKNDESPTEEADRTPREQTSNFCRNEEVADDLYNALNHNSGAETSEPPDAGNQNFYGHLNMHIKDSDTDDTYDAMEHKNQQHIVLHDTYDHMENINVKHGLTNKHLILNDEVYSESSLGSTNTNLNQQNNDTYDHL